MTWRHHLALVGSGIAALLIATPALAVGEVATEMTFRPLEPVVIGSEVRVVVDLRVAGGQPLVDEPVDLALDGEHVRRVRTEPDGSASYRLPRDLPPGDYALHATFPGRTDAYFPTEADFTLVVVSFELEIETVPPLPGMVFTLDGERFEAGPDGLARISIASAGDHALAVLDEEYSVGGQQAEFSRWNRELFGHEITLRIPTAGRVQAGFDINRPASQVFLDSDGGIVDPDRVTSITLRSSLGNVFTFSDGEERFFKASRAVRRPNGLESVPVRYNVDAVEVDGSNVVNAGQQRFFVEGDGPWEITLLLYSALIEPRDALFGFTAGEAVEVTYPNGHVQRVEPDANGALHVQWLARGIYRMGVADAPGWAPAVPVALSRDQEVELRVVTYLDMVLAAAFAATVAIGLLHRGRPHLMPVLGRSAVRRLPFGGRARQPWQPVSPPTSVQPIDDPPELTFTVPEGGLQHVALPVLPALDGDIAHAGTSAADHPETESVGPVRKASEAQTEVSLLPAQVPEVSEPRAKRARAARNGSASTARATPPPKMTDPGKRPKRGGRAAKSAGSSAAQTESVVKASASSSTAGSAKERPRRARRDAGKPAHSPAAATAKPKPQRKTAPPAEARHYRRGRDDSPSDPAVAAAAGAARAEQLALLGLTDADQESQEPIDVTLAGSPRTIGQQNCNRCGLLLWVGARYCRRCGSLRAGPDSSGLHETPAAALSSREGHSANDGTHPIEGDDTSAGLNAVGGSNRGVS